MQRMARSASSAHRRRRKARSRRRRRAALIAAVALVPVLVVAGLVVLVGAAVNAFTLCRADTSGSTLGYTQEQVDNAQTIIAAGRDLGLSVRDQTIGVMTAMGESSLRNIDYGDLERSGVTNPDGSRTTSIGLFQQQDDWGSREERLDPYAAATLFFQAMTLRVPEPERSTLAPTLVAHRTQVNADPDYYATYWPRAVRLVEALVGTDAELDAEAGACS